MFRWILSWLQRRKFERSRALFTFWNGRKFVRIDPLRAYLTLRDHEQFNIEDHPILIANDLGQPETDYFIAAMELAFGIKRFDPETGNGLSLEEMVDLFTDLILWMNETQKKTQFGSRQSEPTDSTSSTGQEAQEEAPNCSLPSATETTTPSYDGARQ